MDNDSKLTRRTLISTVCAVAPVALASVYAAPAAAQAGAHKMAQRAAGYQPTPHATPNGEQRCSGCALFEAPNGCRTVAGNIAPEGWCRLYVPARHPAP